jgi:O-antigen ligase
MLSDDNVITYLFGQGRSALEDINLNDLPYDSDYVYFLVNYGIVGLLIYVFFHIYFMVNRAFSLNNRPLDSFFFYLVSISLFVAISLNFYAEPRVFILTAVMFSSFNTSCREYKGETFKDE